jgi:hypothetical protein
MKKTEITEKMPIFSEGTYIFYHIEFIEDTCRHDWESSSQQVALGTDWIYPFVCADKTFQKGNFYWRCSMTCLIVMK